VVINDIQNEFDEQIIVAPLSTEDINQVEDFEVLAEKSSDNGLERPSKILFNRLQAIDKAVRLKGLIRKTGPEIVLQVNKVLKLVLVLE